MAKLVFPTVQAPYRGFVGEIRGWFNRISSYAENSPDAVPVINTQLDVLASDLGYAPALPDTQVVVQDGQSLAANDDYTVIATVANGLITVTVTDNS